MTVLEKDLQEIFDRTIHSWRLRDTDILITGSAGFLGYYYSNFLLRYQNQLGIKSITLADIKDPRLKINVNFDSESTSFLEIDMSLGLKSELDPTSVPSGGGGGCWAIGPGPLI